MSATHPVLGALTQPRSPLQLKHDHGLMTALPRIAAFVVFVATPSLPAAAEQILSSRLHHLRLAGAAPEWSDFPRDAEAARFELRFAAKPNDGEWALRLRQQDVRQTWKLRLNGKDLGRLVADENDM